jgi:hypothetical protein
MNQVEVGQGFGRYVVHQGGDGAGAGGLAEEFVGVKPLSPQGDKKTPFLQPAGVGADRGTGGNGWRNRR